MVQIPIAGNVPGPVVAIAVVGGVGGLGYAWWRNRQKQATAAAAAATTPDPSTSASTTDPNAYGTDNAYDYGAYTYDPTGGYGTGYGDGGGYNAGPPVPPSVPSPETNAQWSESVVQALTSGGAYSQQAVLAALGVYLTGGTLSADQEGIVRAAVAADGWPPVAGPGNFPPGMHTSPQGGQSPPPGDVKISVPAVTGKNFGAAYNTLTRAGLISVPGKNGTHAAWKVTAQAPKAGTKVDRGTVVNLTVPQPR